MGRRRYSTGMIRPNVEEGSARLQRAVFIKKCDDSRELTLKIQRIIPCEECDADERIFPTVVQFRERNGRRTRIDTYFFSVQGRLLGHDFSGYKEGLCTELSAYEEHDMSTRWIRKYGEDIKNMLSAVLLPESLTRDITVRHLMDNKIEE